MDIKKLRDAGLCTVESVAYMAKRDLVKIKGLSDAKVDKIVDAGRPRNFSLFWVFDGLGLCMSVD